MEDKKVEKTNAENGTQKKKKLTEQEIFKICMFETEEGQRWIIERTCTIPCTQIHKNLI